MEEKYLKILNQLMSKKFNDDEIGMPQEEFEGLIKAFDMKCKYFIREINGKNMIVESWNSEINPFFSLNRIYDTSSDNLSKIEPKRRKKLLQKILIKEVEVENYEQAVILRDMISEIENNN